MVKGTMDVNSNHRNHKWNQDRNGKGTKDGNGKGNYWMEMVKGTIGWKW